MQNQHMKEAQLTYSEKGRIILLPHPVKCLGKNP